MQTVSQACWVEAFRSSSTTKLQEKDCQRGRPQRNYLMKTQQPSAQMSGIRAEEEEQKLTLWT